MQAGVLLVVEGAQYTFRPARAGTPSSSLTYTAGGILQQRVSTQIPLSPIAPPPPYALDLNRRSVGDHLARLERDATLHSERLDWMRRRVFVVPGGRRAQDPSGVEAHAVGPQRVGESQVGQLGVARVSGLRSGQ